MNPLAKLIRDRLDEKGWSTVDVHKQGGPPVRTVQHLADPTVEWRVTPLPSTIEALARGLQIPVTQVQKAAAEAVGGRQNPPPSDTSSVHLERVVALMTELPEQRQAQIADLVSRMIDTWQAEPLTLLPAADRGRRTDAVDTAKKAASERKRQQKQ